MKRTQIYLDEGLDRELRQIAAAEGRSAASVIREAVRAYASYRGPTEGSEDPVLAAAGAFEGGPVDSARAHDRYLYGPASGRAPTERASNRR